MAPIARPSMGLARCGMRKRRCPMLFAKGAEEYPAHGKVLDVPAIMGNRRLLLLFRRPVLYTSPFKLEYDLIAQSKPF